LTTSLDARLAALAEAVDVADGRLDGSTVAAARAVVDRAGKRLGLGVETTVAALAGPTGAGKSSLFNVLAGADVAKTSPLRPTTGSATAAVWGDVGDALLDWLEVPRRHVVGGDGLAGLVLLDLPDFDSVELTHRLEVDRVVELADLLVWVVDPQKYADAAWHDGYVRPLAPYAASMAVALNKADLLSAAGVTECVRDLEALLEREGAGGVPVVAVSAAIGTGIDELRALLAERVAAREAAAARLAADVDVAVARLSAHVGREDGGVRREERGRVVGALAGAAGVPLVVRAVASAHRRRGALATGWPFVRWVRRLRPDPLRRLRLGEDTTADVRTSIPPPSPVQLAAVDGALRDLAAAASKGLPEPWPEVVRGAALVEEERLGDRLDRAVAGADLHVARPRWWSGVSFLQKLLVLAVVAGALWLLVLMVLGYLQVDDVVPLPEVEGIALPTLLLLGGALAGVVLSLLARFANGLAAGRRARAAERSLRRRIGEVADEHAVRPVEDELEAHRRLREALARASRDGGRRRRGRRSREDAGILAAATRGGAVR
jgi:GTP-binding protein EngB required for normal cell division